MRDVSLLGSKARFSMICQLGCRPQSHETGALMSIADRENEPKIDAEEILDGILEWVEIETPTYHADAVNTLADRVGAGIGCATERVPGTEGFGDHVIVRTRIGKRASLRSLCCPTWTRFIRSARRR